MVVEYIIYYLLHLNKKKSIQSLTLSILPRLKLEDYTKTVSCQPSPRVKAEALRP